MKLTRHVSFQYLEKRNTLSLKFFPWKHNPMNFLVVKLYTSFQCSYLPLIFLLSNFQNFLFSQKFSNRIRFPFPSPPLSPSKKIIQNIPNYRGKIGKIVLPPSKNRSTSGWLPIRKGGGGGRVGKQIKRGISRRSSEEESSSRAPSKAARGMNRLGAGWTDGQAGWGVKRGWHGLPRSAVVCVRTSPHSFSPLLAVHKWKIEREYFHS